MNEKTHASLLALAGGYILYLAYEILRDHLKGIGGMSDFVAVLSVTVLTLGGIGALYYAWITYKRSKEKGREEKKDVEDDRSIK